MNALPKYSGELAACEWAKVTLTSELRRNLKQAALFNCLRCHGEGYKAIEEPFALLCHCVNRPVSGNQ